MARLSPVETTIPGMDEPLNPEYDEPDYPDGDPEDLGAEEPQSPEDAAVEAAARKEGWRPLADYRGAPGKWVDAKAFLERGRDFLPFVQKDLRESRAENVRLREEMSGLRGQLDEQGEVLKELRLFARNATQAGYIQARRDIEARMRAAAAEGDTASYDQSKQELDTLVEGRAEGPERNGDDSARSTTREPEPRPQPTPAARVEPEAQAWVDENQWFISDRELNAVMVAEHLRLKEKMPGLTITENLERAKAYVVSKYPEKFGVETDETRRPQAPRTRVVVPPRAPGQRPPARDGFETIADPVERESAKKAYSRWKRQIPDMTVAEYLTIYNNPHADIVTMRREAAAKGRK